MDSLRKLEQLFSSFPGIGPRQAKRFVNFVISRPSSFADEFMALINEVRKSSTECAHCHRFFLKKNITNHQESRTNKIDGVRKIHSQDKLCSVCGDPSRIQEQIMIVSSDSDFDTIEKSGTYNGLYFVLGGIVPILDKEPEKRVRLAKLLERITTSPDLKEVILSLNTTPDGEHTTNIVREAIQNIQNNQILITILGRGLSTGAELEYADTETIKNALENRR